MHFDPDRQTKEKWIIENVFPGLSAGHFGRSYPSEYIIACETDKRACVDQFRPIFEEHVRRAASVCKLEFTRGEVGQSRPCPVHNKRGVGTAWAQSSDDASVRSKLFWLLYRSHNEPYTRAKMLKDFPTVAQEQIMEKMNVRFMDPHEPVNGGRDRKTCLQRLFTNTIGKWRRSVLERNANANLAKECPQTKRRGKQKETHVLLGESLVEGTNRPKGNVFFTAKDRRRAGARGNGRR